MKALAALALLSLVLLAGCGSPSASDAPKKDESGRYVIEMEGTKFVPATAKVPVGATVVWEHRGGAPHDVQAEDGSFSSGMIGGLTEGEEYEHTFETAGSFPYQC